MIYLYSRPAIVALLLLSGCSGNQDDDGASVQLTCDEKAEISAGFEIVILGAKDLPGHCLEISHSDHRIDNPFASQRITQSAEVVVPVEGAGEYLLHVEYPYPDDPGCMWGVWHLAKHPGQGIVRIEVVAREACH